eukprot:s1255_g42.t1
MHYFRGQLLLLLVAEAMTLAQCFCNTPATELFERCPEVLQVGESCPPSCPVGLNAKARVSCQDGLLLVPSCLEINTSTTSSTTSSATTSSSTTSTTTATSTVSTYTATSSTSTSETATASSTSSTSSSSSSSTSSSSSSSSSSAEIGTTRTSTASSNTTTNATMTSTTQFDIAPPGKRCIIASMLWTSCPRYMLHMERCDAKCQSPLTSVGHFSCLAGRFFGSSGCLEPSEASNLAWRGLLLAGALRFGFNSLEQLSEGELLENLRRVLAVCMGISARSILRLRAADLIFNNESGEVISSEVELEFEVSLGSELLNETEVSASIIDLEDTSSPVSLLFRNMLKGYFDIQVTWVQVVMLPVTYSGSLLNFTAPSTSVASAIDHQDPDGTATSVVSGLVLSMAVVPVVAAWVRLVLAEQHARDDLAGAPELRKNGRPKRKSKSRSPGQGPAAVDAG